MTNFPKKSSESLEDSEYIKDSEDSEDLNNIALDESSSASNKSSVPNNAKFLFMCAWQGAQFHK
jgi:hypothetical protein